MMTARILLIDDDKNRRDSVRVILRSNGYLDVEEVDCENATSLLTSEKFDLILLDVTLPDTCGFKVLKYLNENHLSSKVIVITGMVGLKNSIMGTTPVVRDYIIKPYNSSYLLNSIDHILSDRSQTNFKLQIIKAGDFIRSTPTGDLDMKASRDGLAQIAVAGHDLRDFAVLIDLRDVVSRLSTLDILKLASELTTYGKTFYRKTAVLARPEDDLGQATFFETAAQNRGFLVKAFTVFEDAIIWLSSITQLKENLIT